MSTKQSVELTAVFVLILGFWLPPLYLASFWAELNWTLKQVATIAYFVVFSAFSIAAVAGATLARKLNRRGTVKQDIPFSVWIIINALICALASYVMPPPSLSRSQLARVRVLVEQSENGTQMFWNKDSGDQLLTIRNLDFSFESNSEVSGLVDGIRIAELVVDGKVVYQFEDYRESRQSHSRKTAGACLVFCCLYTIAALFK